MIFNMPGCAAPRVKSRASAGICRNLNRILCFHDARRIQRNWLRSAHFADFARPAQLIGVLHHAVWTVEMCIHSCIVGARVDRSILLILPISIMR